jgi:uncharacterized protein (TIGR03083 family)
VAVDWSRVGPPIDVRPLFPIERAQLAELLSSLTASEWQAPTVCPGWSVHDIVAHLAHDHLRRLSGHRDGYRSPGPAPGEDLPTFLARANEEFVVAARGLSPRVLMDVLATFGPQLDALWAMCEMEAIGDIDVWWAAPGVPAPVWLDVAREYSEHWVHRHQIHDAVGRPSPAQPALVHAMADTFLRALPNTLREVPAADGTTITVTVGEPVNHDWTVRRDPAGWSVAPGTSDGSARSAHVGLTPDTLWRLATRGISPDVARARVSVDGDDGLAHAVLQILSIIR